MKSIKKRKGISLVALIITIIVLIIITGTVIITMNNGNIIGKSKEAVFKSDIANYREELSRNILNEQVKGNISGENQVNAAYKQENTKEQAKTDITDIRYWIPDITEDYINKLGVKNGDLYYVSNLKNEQEAKWAEELNIIDTSNMIAEKVVV